MTEVVLAGTRVQLCPQGCAFLPDAGALLVADAHFGKAHSFRRLGVPVPEGPTTGTLHKLDQALAATGATEVVFLGDLLHARPALAAAVAEPVARWRARHPQLTLHLVRGNHDRHAGDPPAAWGVRVHDEPLALSGLQLQHHPTPPADGGYALAGHLHPAVRLAGRGPDALRLPCFHFGARVGVLPAFGEFTGAHLVQPAPGDRVFVLAEGHIVELPAARR